MERRLTHAHPTPETNYPRLKRQVERAVGVADFAIGLTLTLGGLALALYWHWRDGGIRDLRSFYLYTAWAFGTLELVAASGMFRGWAARWVLQMLPLIVPVLAYQYFILHFIFREL